MKLLLIALSACLFTSCALSPSQVQLAATVTGSNYIQYGVAKDKQDDMALLFARASTLPFDHVPTVAEFKSDLEATLPSNQTKALTISNLTSLYALYYPKFSDKLPTSQMEYLKAIQSALAASAAPFLVP